MEDTFSWYGNPSLSQQNLNIYNCVDFHYCYMLLNVAHQAHCCLVISSSCEHQFPPWQTFTFLRSSEAPNGYLQALLVKSVSVCKWEYLDDWAKQVVFRVCLHKLILVSQIILGHLWSLLWPCSRMDFKKRELGLWNIFHIPFGKPADAEVTWTFNVASSGDTATCISSWEICNIYFWGLNLLDHRKLSMYDQVEPSNSRKQLLSPLWAGVPQALI